MSGKTYDESLAELAAVLVETTGADEAVVLKIVREGFDALHEESVKRAVAVLAPGGKLICYQCGQKVPVIRMPPGPGGTFQVDRHSAPCGEVCEGSPLAGRGHSHERCQRCNPQQ